MYRSPRRAAALLAGMCSLSFFPLAAKNYTAEDVKYVLACYPAVVIAPLDVGEPFYPAAEGHDPAVLGKGPKIVLKEKRNGGYVVKIKKMIAPFPLADPTGSENMLERDGPFYALRDTGALQPASDVLLSSQKETDHQRAPHTEEYLDLLADYLSRNLTTNKRVPIVPDKDLPRDTYLFLRISKEILSVATVWFSSDEEGVTVIEERCAAPLEE